MHGAVVAELLQHRPADRLKHMATVLWTVRSNDEPWLAATDRSVYVLRHRAQWLDRRLTDVPHWWLDCPHAPKCGERAGCQLTLTVVDGGRSE
jgi:hypothetical protein